MSVGPHDDGGNPVVRNILLAVAVVYMIGSLIFMVQAQSRISDLEQKQAAGQKQLAKKIEDSNGQTRASVNVLADKLGITHKELSQKASELQTQQHATESRLQADETATKKQFGEVAGEVNGVKGQVSQVKSDVTDTRNDLAQTKTELEHAIGDLNKHSELIATNRDELELLKHRGDRDYFEFTLHKGKSPTRLSLVSLQLRKADAKKNKFTLYVIADDRKIEKKDRTVNEPLQFYTGRERALFEVVVNKVEKNTVTGYLSTPKNAATAQMPSHGGQTK